MRHTFQSFWIGDCLSPYEAVALRSFIDHGHRFQLYCYSDRLQVPSGVELCDAAAILARDDCFAYRGGFGAGSYSACSNLFRYLLLRSRGGWWVDTDVICLSSNIPQFTAFYALEDPDFINGAVLHFAANDGLLTACLREALSVGRDVAWGQIGPRLLTRRAKELGRFAQAQPRKSCYPVHWNAALELLDPRRTRAMRSSTRSSFMLHLWNEIFRQANIDKTYLPPSGSLLRKLADRHPVSGWQGEYVVERHDPAADLALSLRKRNTPRLLPLRHWVRNQLHNLANGQTHDAPTPGSCAT